MNVRHLKAFCKVIETGSMSEAGRLLGVTQPAISKSIRQLELDLQINLFKRVGDRLFPSMEAQRLYPSARRIFDELQATAELSKKLKTAEVGSLKIAATHSVTATYIHESIAAFHRIRPMADIQFMALPPRQIISLVSSREIDAGFLYEPIVVPKVHHIPLCDVQVICALSPHHHLAGKKVIEANDLIGETIISFSDESYTGSRLKSQCQDAGVPWKVSIAVNQTAVAMKMAADGIGVAVVDSLALGSDASKNVIIKPFQPLTTLHVCAIAPQDRPLSRLCDEFISGLATIVKQHAARSIGFHAITSGSR